MRIFVLTIFAVLTLLNAACTSTLPSLKPYRMDIQQGNVVTYKMIQQLRPGMTKSQVRFVMGTPILQDTFHSNRWDYFYQFKRNGAIQDQRRVILEFKDDQLVAVKGDQVGEEVVDPASKTKSDLIVPRSKQSLSERLQFWKADDTAKKTASPDVPAAQANVSAPVKPEKSWTDKLKFWKSETESGGVVNESKGASPSRDSAKAKPNEPASAESSPAPIVAVTQGAVTSASSAVANKSMLAVSPLESVTASAEPAASAEVPSVKSQTEPSAPVSDAASVSAPASEVIAPETKGGAVQVAPATVVESQPLRPYTQAAEPASEAALPLDDSPIEMTLMAERFIATPSSRMKLKEFTPVVGLPVKLQLDRQLRSEFLPNPATDAATEGPADAGPGYFERLLEKIGF